MFTKERLLHLFDYDKENGRLFWKNPPKFQPYLKGKLAGTIQDHGHTQYWFVKIDGIPRLAHRLIWVIETGEQPKGDIDHIDGRGLNNNFKNLRDVTSRQNHQNRKLHRNGKLVGYYFCKHMKKYRSQITIDGTTQFLGFFDTAQEAHQRYLIALEGL